MLKKILLAIILLAAANVAMAWQSGSSYDWNTGSTYNWNTDSAGNLKVNGFNTHTGSTWRTIIKPNGNMRGLDSNMNMWDYNRATGQYFNYGTGEMRINGLRLR